MATGNDTAALVVALSAQLTKFEKDMDQAHGLADRAVKRIEQRFAGANLTVGKLLGASATGTAIGSALADPLQFAIDKAKSLRDEFAQTATMAKLLQISIERVQEVQFAFELGGGNFDQFRAGSEQFLRNAEEAKRALDEMGTLSKKQINQIENDFARVFRANGVALTDAQGKVLAFDELLARAADLIKNAKSEMDKVRLAEMLGLSREWVRALEKGGDAFRAAAASAQEAGAVIDRETIQRAKDFDKAWDRSATQLKAAFKSVLVDIRDGFSALWTGLSDEGVFGFFERKIGALFGSIASKSKSELRHMLAELETTQPYSLTNPFGPSKSEIENQKVAILEELAVRAERARRMISVGETGGEVGGGAAGAAPGGAGGTPTGDQSTKVPFKLKNRETGFDQEVQQLQKRTALLDTETATIAKGTFEKEKARATTELLQAAEKAGLTVTDEMRAKIDAVAAAYGRSTLEAEKARAKLNELNEASRELGSALSSAFQAAVIQGQQLNEVLSNLANRLASKSIDKLFDLFFSPQAGSSTSAFGGLFSGIFGGIGKNAEGTDNWRGGLTWVGEQGPEILNLPRGSQVIPNDAIRSAPGGSNISVALSMDLTGANGDATIERIAGRAARQAFSAAVAAANAGAPGRQARYAALGT